MERPKVSALKVSVASVSVRITGETKEVTSGVYHVAAKSGLQAKFVDAAANLDKIIGTDRWIKCDEARRQPYFRRRPGKLYCVLARR